MSAQNPEDLSRLFAERASAGDLDLLLQLYEPEARVLGPNGDEAGGEVAIRERLSTLLAMKPSIASTDVRVVDAGDIALISSRWSMSFGREVGERGRIEGTSTEVARRQPDGSWLYLINDPSSSSTLFPASRFEDTSHGEATEPEQLVYEEDGPVARITLNRPRRRNALSMQLSDELIAALERVRTSETVKVLVIAGAGETFCAGDDITEMGLWGDANQIMRRVANYQRMADTLEALDKVTIAAVDGHAVGGGLEITMACDFVIATRRAVWGMPEVDVGITPGWGGTTRMARLIGRRLTKEINLLGALHPADRAAELGLWNRVVDDDQLEVELDALIDVILAKNQQAVRQIKFIVNNGVEADLHTAQGFEALSAGLTGAVNGAWRIEDADRAAGVVSFLTDGERWRDRRTAARDFWVDGPIPASRDAGS
jgi:enoyl-CoA hydratase